MSTEDKAAEILRRAADRLKHGEPFDADLGSYQRQRRLDAARRVGWVMVRIGHAALAILCFGAFVGLLAFVIDMHIYPIGVPTAAARAGSVCPHRKIPTPPAPTRRSLATPPLPTWEDGAGVLQLFTVNDRRSADIDAAELRTTFAMQGGRDWAVRVVVVPWWGNRWTVVVNGTTRPSGAAMCQWLREWGRQEMPPPEPNRAQGRTMCQQHPGPWPQERPSQP